MQADSTLLHHLQEGQTDKKYNTTFLQPSERIALNTAAAAATQNVKASTEHLSGAPWNLPLAPRTWGNGISSREAFLSNRKHLTKENLSRFSSAINSNLNSASLPKELHDARPQQRTASVGQKALLSMPPPTLLAPSLREEKGYKNWRRRSTEQQNSVIVTNPQLKKQLDLKLHHQQRVTVKERRDTPRRATLPVSAASTPQPPVRKSLRSTCILPAVTNELTLQAETIIGKPESQESLLSTTVQDPHESRATESPRESAISPRWASIQLRSSCSSEHPCDEHTSIPSSLTTAMAGPALDDPQYASRELKNMKTERNSPDTLSQTEPASRRAEFGSSSSMHPYPSRVCEANNYALSVDVNGSVDLNDEAKHERQEQDQRLGLRGTKKSCKVASSTVPSEDSQ
ncbi:hypothetical protein cyc_01867 [Cyclospora cayetanensis]|uniref:Uncharacterized protein n=1 Tax=Cyclospora cayetanensis TaxID=88456 RepID=A0A1D3D3Q7_9EIME|nr:hypothetical protein cyc_01867 [Cyclospora cayetanensis]